MAGPNLPAPQVVERLKHAVASGDLSRTEVLLATGCDPNHTDERGATLLIHAAARGHAAVCRCLLDHGADPYRLDRFGRDAMGYAKGNGHDRVVETIDDFIAKSIADSADPGSSEHVCGDVTAYKQTTAGESSESTYMTMAEVAKRKRRLRDLIVAGKECGFLTTAQIQSCVPDGILDKTQIAGIYAMLEQMGIKVIPPQEQGAEGWEREPTALPPAIDDEEEQIRSDLLRELLVFAPEQHEVDEALSEVCDELLESLTPLEAGLLRARFGMDGEKEQSFTELSKKYNFSVERLRQIEAKALRKLRHPSRSEKLRTFLEGEY